MSPTKVSASQKAQRRSSARNQHHVPRMLQAPFATAGDGKTKHVHIFDKQTDRTFRAATENNFSARDFNTFDQDDVVLCLEDGMAAIEDMAAPVIRKIIEERSVASLTVEERSKLSVFAALQKVRGVAMRAQIGGLTEALRERLRAGGEDPDAINHLRAGDGAGNLKLMALNLVRDHLGEFAQSFENKVLLAMASAAGQTFLLGDTPVTWTNKTDTGPYGSLGLEVRGIELYLPISPDLSLAFWCPSLIERLESQLAQAQADTKQYGAEAILGVGDRLRMAAEKVRIAQAYVDKVGVTVAAIAKGTPATSDAPNMDYVNALQISQAERYVASADGDFRLAHRMMADNPNFRRGRRFKVN